MDIKRQDSNSSEESAKCMTQFSVKEVSSWIATNFKESMAAKFESESVSLIARSSIEQIPS